MNANEGGASAVVQAASKVGVKRIVFLAVWVCMGIGIRSRRSEVGGQRTEAGKRQRSEDRDQRAEIKGQRSEITTEDTPLEPTNPYGE